MRTDAIGLFWEDIPTGRGKRGEIHRPMPPIPETGWRAPKDLPDLSRASIISLDTETFDPELKEHGPGWARGKGHVVGISVAVDMYNKWYFPIRHETCPEENMDPETVLRWARDNLTRPNQIKTGANLTYDLGWLRQEGVHVRGRLCDVQFAEALLDEAAEVNLDALMSKYLGKGKQTSILYRFLADWFGGPPTESQRKWMYKSPPSLAGPYAETDATGPLELLPVLSQKLTAEGLHHIFDMENALIYLMLDMRFAGVRVDIPKAEQLRDTLEAKKVECDKQIRSLVGFDVNPNSSSSLASAFDSCGLSYPRTKGTSKNPNGAPSFTKDFLKEVDHPLGVLINSRKSFEKLKSTFVESYILDSHVNGMIYGQFHLLRGDAEGTRSGRFSSSTPNLQNLPSKDEELAPLVRGIFVPDYGHVQWRKYDQSQIEYRCLAHYAVGAQSDHIRNVFRTDPKADYHQAIIDLIEAMTGIRLERKPAKTVNFGLIYGMGEKKLGASLHLTPKATKELFKAYHSGAPFAKATMDECAEEARQTGVVKTILGRKSRFDLWEPDGWGRSDDAVALPLQEALLRYGSIRRAYLHKALNRKLQGSAADIMKLAMLKCYQDGVFNYTGIPRLTVHDELDFSDPGGQDQAYDYMAWVMENALPLNVPLKVECEIGPDWGHGEKV